MADGTEDHDSLLGADDPGSMAYKLAHAGEAPPGGEKKAPEELEADRQEEEARIAAEEKAAAEEETQEAAAEAETAEKAAAEEEAQKAALEPPKPKFESLEEYDKAYKEAETRMHTATEEAAKERKAREEEAKAAEEALKAKEAEAETARKELEDFKAAQEAAKSQLGLKERYAEALKKVRSIKLDTDPDTGETIYPPDYDDQVAEAWAGTGVDPEKVAKEAARIAREELRLEQEAERKEREATAAKTAEEKEAEEQAKIRADAEKLAVSKGLDMTPGSADHRIFYTFVNELASTPEHEYREKPFEEQVEWAVSGVKELWGKKLEMTDAERKAARRNQNKNAVLERGITRTVTDEKPRQRSMQEILAAQS